MEYANKSFAIDYLKRTDIQKVGVFYSTPKDNVKDKKYLCDCDDDYFIFECTDVYDICEDYCNVEYAYYDYDMFKDFIDYLMNHKKYEHFLVVAYGCTWRKSTGYSFVHNYEDCFKRNCDVSQYYVKSSPKGKVLVLNEYTHDVPTGYNVVIIGLTDSEYQKLDNSCYDDVIAFSNKHLEKIGE